MARQTGIFNYEIRLNGVEKADLEKQESSIIKGLNNNGFLDVEIDWDADKDDDHYSAYLTFGVCKDDVDILYGSYDWDEDNEACIDPEPDSLENEIDIEDITIGVREVFSLFGLLYSDITLIDYTVDDVNTVIETDY